MRTAALIVACALAAVLSPADVLAQRNTGPQGRGTIIPQGRGTRIPIGPRGRGVPAPTGRGRGGRGRGPGNTEGVEVRSYLFEPTGEEMEWALFVSSKVDPERPSPLVIALHGRGVGPTSIVRDLVIESAEAGGYIVAAPMGYNEQGWFGIYESDRSTPLELREYSEQDVMNVLAIVRDEFNVDENRIYIMGASMGGAGAFYLAHQHSDIWAAVGAGAPAFRDSQRREDVQEIRDLPVVLVHGTADALVSVDVSRRLAAHMDSIGMTNEYYEIPGGTHPDALGVGAPFVFDFFDRHVKAEAGPADVDSR